MPYYGDGAPYYYGGAFSNHSSLMTGIGRSYHNPIAARYSPHLSTISESPLSNLIALRRYAPSTPTITTSLARPRRIIDTADIDVSRKPRTLAQENRQQRHRLRRDRATIKIRSQALKDNPALREYNERHEKSVGELLVEKFLIKDKQEEGEHKMKLYHQASLMTDVPSIKERENDLLAAIRRRVTRRMTRRRSSVDVIPLDPEQIEREAAYHAAQAEALDNLVAEEQAEIEVEMRRGTFARRPTLRLPVEVSEVSGSEDDGDEMEEEERHSKTKKHPTTKKKKRRKLEDKPKSEDEDEEENAGYNLSESVIEEEEFEWDDREKCDDIAAIVPKEERTTKSEKVEDKAMRTYGKLNEKAGKVDVTSVKDLDTVSHKKKPVSPKPEIKEAKVEEKKEKIQEKKKEELKPKDKMLENPSNLQRSKSPVELVPRFKIEACNSVGDFSTLYIKGAATSPEETSPRTIEQFRESIRLPAPRSEAKPSDTEVLLPVRKPYVRDTSRNSAYLALKPPSMAGADEQQIIDGETRKESDTSRPANKSRGGDRSPIGRDALAQSTSADDEARSTYSKLEKPPRESSKPSLLKGGKEEFVSWWDETEEEKQAQPVVKISKVEEKVVEAKKEETVRKDKNKLDTGSKLRDKSSPVPIEKKEDKIKVEPTSKVSEKLVDEVEKKIKEPAYKAKDKAETVTTGKISDLRNKVGLEKPVEDSADKAKAKSEVATTGKISDLRNKVEPEKKAEDSTNKAKEKAEVATTGKISDLRNKVELEKKAEDSTNKVKVKAEAVKTEKTSDLHNKTGPEKKIESSTDKNKDKTEAVSIEKTTDLHAKSKPAVEKTVEKVDISKSKISDLPSKAKPAVEKVVDKTKNKVETVPAIKVSEPSNKSKLPIKVVDESTKSAKSETKDKPIDKITETKDKVSKSVPAKDVKPVEKPKPQLEKKSAAISDKSTSSETTSALPSSKVEPISLTKDKKPINNDVQKPARKITDRRLPNIPEEPKSASPTERSKPLLFNKKETQPQQPLIKPPNIAGLAKDERKKKVDSEAVMKIEKKILEDADKILSGPMMPPPGIIDASPLAKKEEKQNRAASPSVAKVGLQQQPTKKKSSEPPPPATAAAATEIDFWSEIRAQEGSAGPVSGKVQSPRIDEKERQARKSPEPLRLDLTAVQKATSPEEDLKTPLVLEQEELKTPLVLNPSTPLLDNLVQVPLINLQLTKDRPGVVDSSKVKKEEERPRDSVKEDELSGTVKKISKWTNRDNLSNLNEADGDVTPVASKEVSPQQSAQSSTTKKKVVKKKKSTTGGTKKKAGDDSTKSKTSGKKAAKKANMSPPATQTKQPINATGSPRNLPSQRPAELTKLFYTTPAILLTATPRDLRKVRRAKVKRKKPANRTASLSSDSTGSTRSTATTSTEESSNCEEDAEHKRLASTRSNDSGFDGSPRLSTPSQSSENQRNTDGEHFHHSGRITPPATNLPRFKKYEVTDFNFLKVLGKGSFGKVLLAELRGTECVYAVKCLKKDVVLEDDDVECTLIERKVLTLATRHPYLCHLFCTFQTESHLFFVMEYLNGGDLMFHIQKSGRFNEPRAKFYAAEIWSGLIFLHKKGIVYRDLKLDNVLLDFEGHIRIADFGMCKLQIFLDRTADTFCGTPDYMAPEIIKGLKYNQAVDWWSYGVLLYEMLTGQSPFSGCDEDELFWSICNERPFIPRYLGQSATDLLVCLLEKDSGKRIPGHEIACHPFFCTIAWDKLERRTLEPPFKPAVEHTLDTRYFDTAFTAERPRLTPVPEQILTSMDQGVFRGFSYTNPNATD